MSEEIIDEIGQPFGKEGLRFLFLFKIIKQQVREELKVEGKTQPNEKLLNEICAKAAEEFLTNNEQAPTREEISKSISRLRCKLEQNR